MPTGAAVMPPPPSYLPPPQPLVPPPAYPRRRPGWLAVSVMLALALLLALSATVMSAVKLSQSTPAATTTTITAPPPPPPSYSPDQVAAAKKEACGASDTADQSMLAAQRNFFDAARDRQSPQYHPALGNFQLVAMLETQYMQQHLPPATPKNVLDAINNYITAVIALVDANTRELSDHDAQPFVLAVRNAGDQLDKVCE
ncbi:hypothetical protein BN1232_06279 [Mycobacterium lentiflavum]|uniref:Alanine and proline rich membrane protein n=3 Tax=Mycobacterium simiae complex TaxID=2249310 RepID=A0A0E3WED4_MYCLN|nr:hypothetical protein BN1232_06279 [Mycobacterium lentiflavum]